MLGYTDFEAVGGAEGEQHKGSTMRSILKRWLASGSERVAADARQAMPIHGPAKFSFTLSELRAVTLSDWPHFAMATDGPEARRFMDEAKRNWDQAEGEARRHWSVVQAITAWSPYPSRSYCLGAAEVVGEMIRMRHRAGPCGVAQLIYEARVGAASGGIQRAWVDPLREDELSDENRRHISQAPR